MGYEVKELDVNQMNFVRGIIHRWLTVNSGFKAYPPSEVYNDPSVIRSDDVIERLRHTTWRIVLTDGTQACFSFHEFLTFVLHCRMAMLIEKDIDAGRKPRQMRPGSDSVSEIMCPERVKFLLKHVEFER
jgi:hypothetical protein